MADTANYTNMTSNKGATKKNTCRSVIMKAVAYRTSLYILAKRLHANTQQSFHTYHYNLKLLNDWGDRTLNYLKSMGAEKNRKISVSIIYNSVFSPFYVFKV